LGNKETGAKAALPIWMDFMATALPRQGASRDFLPIPDEIDRDLVRQASDISPLSGTGRGLDQEATDEPKHALARPTNKTPIEQSNVALQEHPRR